MIIIIVIIITVIIIIITIATIKIIIILLHISLYRSTYHGTHICTLHATFMDLTLL